jgi:serine/threonine protein kinase
MKDNLERGTLLGRYELLLQIGRGGMASVWVAHEHADSRSEERIVAVKVMLPDLAENEDFVAMFLDEGRLVQRIRHAHVVELYEVGEAAGFMFMAMEWVEGESLHTLIAEAGKRRPIPSDMAVRIIADAASGLHAAHETSDDAGVPLNVVHRDVSPHNILIGTNGKVKLVDFGVAKARERLTEATSVGHVKGKFGYMSPEQALARVVDRRSDVFSLGIVLYELTTGKRLFRGENDAETLQLVVQGDIPRPRLIDPHYPEALEAIVMKALSRSRRERFQTARDFQRDLERFLKNERVVVPRAGLASLLKKVVGERIQKRRDAVRHALHELAGKHELVSDDSAFHPADAESESVPSGLTDLSKLQELGLSPSQISKVTELTGSFVGLRAQAPGSAAAGPPGGWGNVAGYVVGAVGLLFAALMLVLYLTRVE